MSDASRADSPVVVSDATGVARRSLLKGTAGILAAGMFPAVHAQEKIVLRYLGTAVNQDKAIAEKFKADTGIEIQYVAVTTDDVTKRAVTAPNSFDLIDTEYFSLKKIVPTGNLKGIDTKRIKNADKITTLFTTGMVAGKAVGDQGTAPKKVIYLEGEKSKKFATAPTQFMSLIPTVYNADTLGIRPDLIKRPINSWAELLNAEFKGKAAILNIPSIGIMDAAMVVEAMGIYKYPDKGNMTKKEIDLTIKTLIEAKKQGQFRALWKDFNESVNLMASGEVVIQSMWSPAVTAVRTKGIACNFQPLKEGYRAWAAGFGLPTTLSGRKLDGAYEFINWFLNSDEANDIMMGERGTPASATAREHLINSGKLSAQQTDMFNFVDTAAAYCGDTPAADPAGISEINTIFKNIGYAVFYGQTTPADAAAQFRTEVNAVLEANN